MTQELNINIRKGNEMIVVGSWATSVARETSRQGMFSYTEDFKTFSPENVKKELTNYIDRHFNLQELQEEEEDCLKLAKGLETNEAVERILAELDNIREARREMQEDKELYQSIVSLLETCIFIQKWNEGVEFYYTNC